MTLTQRSICVKGLRKIDTEAVPFVKILLQRMGFVYVFFAVPSNDGMAFFVR